MSSMDRLPEIGVINLSDLQRKTNAYPSYFGGTMPYGFDDSTLSFPGMFNSGAMTMPYCPPSQPTLTPSAQQAQAQLAAKYSANSATAKLVANAANGDDLAQIRANQQAAVRAVQTRQNEQHTTDNNQNNGIDAKTGKPIDKSWSRIGSKAGKGIVDMLNPVNWFTTKDENGKRHFSLGRTLTTIAGLALVAGVELISGGTATPLVVGAFTALGAVQTAQGVTQACNATTQDEFDNGCSNAGSGLASMALSLVGVRGAKVLSVEARAAKATRIAADIRESNPDLAAAIEAQAAKVTKISGTVRRRELSAEMDELNFLTTSENVAPAAANATASNAKIIARLEELYHDYRSGKLPNENNGGASNTLLNIIKRMKKNESGTVYTAKDLETEALNALQPNTKGRSYAGLSRELRRISREMNPGFMTRRANAAKAAVSKGANGVKTAVTGFTIKPALRHPVAFTEVTAANYAAIGETAYLRDANDEHDLQAQREAEETQRQEAAKPFEQQVQDHLNEKAQSAIANYGLNPEAIQVILDKDEKKVTAEMKEAEIKKLVDQKRAPLIDEFVQWGGQRNVIDQATDAKVMAAMIDQQRNQYVQYASTHGLLKDGMTPQQVMDAVKRSQDEEAERLKRCQNTNFFTMPNAF